MQELSLKKGDTFIFTATFEDESGAPITGQAENMDCSVRTDKNALMGNAVIVETSTAGTYELRIDNTEEWELGDLLMDIKIVIDGIISRTDTITVACKKEITL